MAHGFQSNSELDNLSITVDFLLETNFNIEQLKEAESLLLLSKEDFVELITKSVRNKNGEENKMKKDRLNAIRIFLGHKFISKFRLDGGSHVIQNRTSAIEMADDCWYLGISIKNKRIENECIETIFRSESKNQSESSEDEEAIEGCLS